MSDPVVHLTAGIPDSGTGNVTTLGQLAGTAGSASTLVQSIQGIASMTPILATVTNAGTFIVQSTNAAETTKVIGTANLATQVGGALTATSNALDVNVKTMGGATTAPMPTALGPAVGSGALLTVAATDQAPIAVKGSYAYHTVAASTGPTTMGTGATGDILMGIYVIPSSTTVGAITITDNSTVTTVYAGGTYNADLKPFLIDLLGIKSVSGAWKITTLAGASVIGIGIFT